MALSEILTDSLIRQMAGSRFYARGEGYYLEERVIHFGALNEKISATVAGTHDYRVRLWEEGDGLGYSCDCPVGRGRFIDYRELPTYWRYIDTAIDGTDCRACRV